MAANKPRLRLLADDEIESLPDPEWLVDGILPVGSFVVLYGPPSLGKTFVAMDLARCVATGTSWHSHEVRSGPVLYIAAEGRSGLKPRRRAWNQEHDCDSCDEMWYLDAAVQLADPEDLDELMTLVSALERPPALIVIDTLARCFVGMDENSSTEMGRLVSAVDTLRSTTGATVLLLHHSGKPRSKRTSQVTERGSSALKGAVDVMISLVSGKEGLVLNCEKQKEAEPFDPIAFWLKPVTIGDGQESCVVACEDIKIESTLDANHRAAVDALADFNDCSATTTEWWRNTAIPERTFYRVADDLVWLGAVERKRAGKNVVNSLNLKWVSKQPTTATAKSLPENCHGSKPSSLPPLPHPRRGGRLAARDKGRNSSSKRGGSRPGSFRKSAA